MDSLDPVRCKNKFASDIAGTLSWAGIEFDGLIHHQYHDDFRFLKKFNELKEAQLTYPCFCSRKEALRLTEDGHPYYNGTCRRLPSSVSQRRIHNGDPHCWRFRVQCEGVTLNDIAAGELDIPSIEWGGDFVLWRRDNCPAYPLASVVDDVYLNITEINRGRDLIAPSAAQTLLFHAFNQPIPGFLHFPLLTDSEGKKLSKRKKETAPETQFQNGKAFMEYWASAFQIPLSELQSQRPGIETICLAAQKENILFKT